jgi:hypothetical protein
MKTTNDLRNRKIKSALAIGAVGGLFWSLVGYLSYFMNFTVLGPSMWIRPFVSETFVDKPLAHLLGVVVATGLSILVGLSYVFLLSRFYSPLIGILYGGALFLIVHYMLNPLFHFSEKQVHNLGLNTFVSEICLFILYGLFIGFSLSTEFSSKGKSAQ